MAAPSGDICAPVPGAKRAKRAKRARAHFDDAGDASSDSSSDAPAPKRPRTAASDSAVAMPVDGQALATPSPDYATCVVLRDEMAPVLYAIAAKIVCDISTGVAPLTHPDPTCRTLAPQFCMHVKRTINTSVKARARSIVCAVKAAFPGTTIVKIYNIGDQLASIYMITKTKNGSLALIHIEHALDRVMREMVLANVDGVLKQLVPLDVLPAPPMRLFERIDSHVRVVERDLRSLMEDIVPVEDVEKIEKLNARTAELLAMRAGPFILGQVLQSYVWDGHETFAVRLITALIKSGKANNTVSDADVGVLERLASALKKCA